MNRRPATASAPADVDAHMKTLFGNLKVADTPFLPLVIDCLATTGTPVQTWKTFRRLQRAFVLGRYFERASRIPGAHVECGVYRGFSALLLARIAHLRDPAFRGAGLHLVDSFEGLSAPTARDVPSGAQGPADAAAMEGAFATPIETVRDSLAAFPLVSIHRGWVPEVLAKLPELRWSFVHLDVDLYEPTLACLEYFTDRLAPGGIIINDDHRSPIFPGAGAAWDSFMESRELPFLALDTGQAVFVRPG